MKVRVIKGFSGRTPDGQQVHYGEGDELELPRWADWLEAGLVEVASEVEVVEFAVSERERMGRGKTRKNADKPLKKKEG